MQDYVTPLPFGLLLAAHAACVAAVGTVLAWPMPAVRGWRVVGSARSDAEFQMRVALLLAVVFTGAAAGTGFYMATLQRTALRWRGAEIRWRRGGREYRQQFSGFAGIRRGLDGRLHIRFADGTILKLDWYAQNGEAFLVRFSEELGEDVY